MKFAEITPAEFRDFAMHSPYKSFMQTPEIAQLRLKSGWTPHYLAVKDQDGQIMAATLIVEKPNFLGKSYFYAPGGPLLDLENTNLTNFFFRHLKKYVKAHKGYVIQIEPYYELIERDRDGKIVEGGFNHQKALTNLKKLGFRPLKDTSQPQYLFALDINHRSPEELFASFKQNTRNLISRTKRSSVEVRELDREELSIFKHITEATSERRHFSDRTISYYEQMYDLFHSQGEVKFIIAEAVIDHSSLPQNSSENKTDLLKESAKKSTSKVPLSVAMFMLYGDEVVYLFSGSDEKYMKEYNAQYAIQWHMIEYATKHGFKRYNFYGIQGLPDPAHKDYGIYRFKKGFGGQVIELIGSFELPVSPFYYLYRALSKLKRLF